MVNTRTDTDLSAAVQNALQALLPQIREEIRQSVHISSGPTWLFNIDSLTKTMNYQLVTVGNQSNPSVGVQDKFDAEKAEEEIDQQYVLFPVSVQSKKQDDKTKRETKGKSPIESFTGSRDLSAKFEDLSDDSINEVNDVGTLVPIVGQISPNNTNTFSAAGPSNAAASPTHGKSSCIDASQLPYDPDMPELEDITYSDYKDDVGAEADFNNLETSITVSHIPTTRVHKDHPMTQIIGDLSSATQTRKPKRVHQGLKDPSWIEAMQEELLQFKMQKVWILVDLPYGKRAIGTKWVFRNKKDERGIVKKDGIFISQDKYVAEILRKFGLIDEKSASTPIDTEKPILKNPDGEDVDVHIYRSIIGSLMYLTSSRPDIMFVVCACARFQVTPKDSHLHAVKRIFRYLKGKPHLGLWYPKDLPFDLVAYSDSDYAGASLDRKSTTGGCQFLRCRLISWQCKKQTVVATSSTEAKYVAAASCCAQVLWIQNQLLDYGYNIMHTVVLSGMVSLKRMLHVTTILSAGLLTTQQMVLNSPCLTHIKNWLVQIKRSLNTVAIKKVNDVIRLQALVDKKKVVLTKATIRDALRLDDAEGVQCLPNEEIFTELARMGYEKPSTKLTFYKEFFSSQWKFVIHTILQCMSAKRTSWKEFGSSMASAIIFLSSGRKINLSKYIFDSLVRNVDSPSKFYMYPYFLQLMIRKQVGDLSTHNTMYTSPDLTQKVFANMRKVGKGVSGIETPLFEGMLVAQEVGEGVADAERDEGVTTVGVVTEGDVSVAHDEVPTANEEPSISSLTPPTPPPQPSQDIPSTYQAQSTPPQSPQVQLQSPQVQPQTHQPQLQPTQATGLPMNLLQEVMTTCTALTRRVEHLELDTIAQALEFTKLKRRVKKLERRNKVKVLKLRRLQKVRTTQRVETSDETMMDDVSNQGRMIAKIDQDVDVVLEDDKEEDESEQAEVQEVVDVVTTAKIITEVVIAASETIIAASTTITAVEAQVPAATLSTAPSRVTATPRRRTKGVVIRDPEESTTTTSTIIHTESKSKDNGKGILVEEPKPLKKQAQIEQDEQYARELEAELNRTIDWDEVIDHVKMKAKEDPAMKRYQALKRKPQTEAQARKNMMIYLKNFAGFKMDYFKGMTYDDIRLIFEAKFESNVAFLQKIKEHIKEEESRAEH
nr:uncharacterized mitochondrial protein AtMg00810-like [Tanacetum cinerariifolium]